MRTLAIVCDYIKSFEGLKLLAYLCPAGIPTIGYGCTHPDGRIVTMGMTCTKDQAEKWFNEEVESNEKTLSKMLQVEINDHQMSSCVDILYNIGSGNFQKSSILSFINKKDFDKAVVSILQHNKAKVNGVLTELSGLTKRRKFDARIFLETDPAKISPLPHEIPTPEELAEIEAADLINIDLETWDQIIDDFNNNLPPVQDLPNNLGGN
jgi:lysozyme